MADLLSLDDAENKMADLDRMKNHCKEMLMIFETLLTSYDPAVVDPNEWDYKIFFAWDDLDICIERMINRHGVAMGTDAINEWKQISMESEQKYLDNYAVTKEAYKVFTAQVKTAEVEIAFEAEIEEGKEVDLIVFDEEKCFDKGKEVEGIFEDNGTLLDTPIDESLFSSELLKSPEIADELNEVPKVRADHYDALTGEDVHSEALAGEEDDYEARTGEGACSEALAGEDDHSEALTGTMKAEIITHGMASHNNNQVGKQASYETCYRLKDKALHGLVKVTGLDDSYYMHDVVKEEKLLTDLSREVPRKVEPDQLQREENRHGKVSILAVGGALLGVSHDATEVTNPGRQHGKSGQLRDMLLHTCCDMFMTLKTSFSQYDEVERCGNRMGWLLQVRAVQWCIAWT